MMIFPQAHAPLDFVLVRILVRLNDLNVCPAIALQQLHAVSQILDLFMKESRQRFD
jgi:hypothetical protein